MAIQLKKSTVKKNKKAAPNGVAHIQSTFNNTIITITNSTGEIAAEKATKEAIGQGVKKAEVLICGPGAGRETAVRALQAAGLEITLIRDITPVPHNGCRPPKKRRI
jgi:small subunit ribosomal protein S11